MASGWAGDGAVQDQIQDSINDEVARARRNLPKGESLHFCEECGEPIPEARRKALPGVRLCVACQEEADKDQRRQPLQPPRQQGQPVALKSGDGKIGESFGEGRRRGGNPRRMTEWERRGVEGGCPARFGQRPHQ